MGNVIADIFAKRCRILTGTFLLLPPYPLRKPVHLCTRLRAKSEQLARSPQAVSPNDSSAPQKMCSAQEQLARIKLVQLECLIPRADLLFANLCKSACLAVAIFDILPANSGATRIRPDLMKSCGTVFSELTFSYQFLQRGVSFYSGQFRHRLPPRYSPFPKPIVTPKLILQRELIGAS
jgi:hypothetical protein